jgi:hypothetical protein
MSRQELTTLAWRKSSFSDPENCVELAWRKSSYSHPNDCVEVAWRKSSRSHPNNCVEVAWRKSSHSHPNECVELAWPGNAILVRNSKNPAGPILMFEHSRFGRLLASLGHLS